MSMSFQQVLLESCNCDAGELDFYSSVYTLHNKSDRVRTEKNTYSCENLFQPHFERASLPHIELNEVILF